MNLFFDWFNGYIHYFIDVLFSIHFFIDFIFRFTSISCSFLFKYRLCDFTNFYYFLFLFFLFSLWILLGNFWFDWCWRRLRYLLMEIGYSFFKRIGLFRAGFTFAIFKSIVVLPRNCNGSIFFRSIPNKLKF